MHRLANSVEKHCLLSSIIDVSAARENIVVRGVFTDHHADQIIYVETVFAFRSTLSKLTLFGLYILSR